MKNIKIALLISNLNAISRTIIGVLLVLRYIKPVVFNWGYAKTS